MVDAVYPIQKAYKSLLSTINYNGDVPVYYQYIPDGMETPNYIIFGAITDSDRSTMNTQDSLISIQVKIHTWADKYNDGKAVAMIAKQVLQLIYPLNGPNIDLSADGLQLHSTKKVNDFTENWTIQNQRVYVDRTIIFSHNIYYL